MVQAQSQSTWEAPEQLAPESARQWMAYLVILPRPPKRNFVMLSICAAHGCMAAQPRGTGGNNVEVLYDLLEVRITNPESRR